MARATIKVAEEEKKEIKQIEKKEKIAEKVLKTTPSKKSRKKCK